MVPRRQKPGKQSRKTEQGAPPLRSAPGRASDRPFCAYSGPGGETCAETANLEEVFVIEGPPRLTWLACPIHQEAVRQIAASFVLRSQATPNLVQFRYHGEVYELWVTSTRKIL